MPYKNKNSSKKILALIVLIVLGVGGYWLYAKYHAAKPSYIQNGINYAPPTAQDKAYSQSLKAGTSTPGHQNSQTNSSATQSTNDTVTKNKVYPLITTTNQTATSLTANGQVTGVAESGGTCTLTLTKGGTTITGTHPGEISGQATTCGQIEIPLSKLSAGTWQAVLGYSSSTSAGTSSPTNVTITQ